MKAQSARMGEVRWARQAVSARSVDHVSAVHQSSHVRLWIAEHMSEPSKAYCMENCAYFIRLEGCRRATVSHNAYLSAALVDMSQDS